MQAVRSGGCTIEDPHAVAPFLSDCLNGVDRFRSAWEDTIDGEYNDADDEDGEDGDTTTGDFEWSAIARIYHKRWQMVARLISLFAAVRMQERHWKRKAADRPMRVPWTEVWEGERPMEVDSEMDDFRSGVQCW